MKLEERRGKSERQCERNESVTKVKMAGARETSCVSVQRDLSLMEQRGCRSSEQCWATKC